MEDAAKAIELAVGVIIFVVAVTIAIVLYNNLADTANNALSINETQNNITYNESDITNDFGYIYTTEDIYYLIKDISNNTNDIYDDLTYIYIYKGHTSDGNIKEDSVQESSEIRRTKTNIEHDDVYGYNSNDSKYKVKYKYKYNEKNVLTELNTHKPEEIYIIQYVE